MGILPKLSKSGKEHHGGQIVSHMSHITNPSFLVYQMYVAQTKKKPESKTGRTGEWIESNAVTEVNHDRNSDGGESDGHDSDSDASGGRRGFDFTV